MILILQQKSLNLLSKFFEANLLVKDHFYELVPL